MKPKALIVRTAGTNCDKETEYAFQLAGADAFVRHINHLKSEPTLEPYQIIALPGGFSYGDDLGAGKILSIELLLWLQAALRKFISKGGLIIGICNGFQVLVKTGILPDADFTQKVTLMWNDSARFEARWTYLKVKSMAQSMRSEAEPPRRRPRTIDQKKGSSPENIWLKELPEVIALPVAHGEGKFYAEQGILDTIEERNQIALQYVDSRGEPAGYPLDPNGSLKHIAGITDPTGRVFGLMPHPERFVFKHHWPYWREAQREPYGLQIFKNAVGYFK